MDCAALHVVMSATHCFEDSLMDTVVRGNVNPIERVELTMLVMGTVIHGVASSELGESEPAASTATTGVLKLVLFLLFLNSSLIFWMNIHQKEIIHKHISNYQVLDNLFWFKLS